MHRGGAVEVLQAALTCQSEFHRVQRAEGEIYIGAMSQAAAGAVRAVVEGAAIRGITQLETYPAEAMRVPETRLQRVQGTVRAHQRVAGWRARGLARDVAIEAEIFCQR